MLAVVLAGIVARKVVFSTRSLTFECHPAKVLAYSSSPVVVRIVALNRLGFKVPFVHLDGNFAIQEGAERIKIVSESKDHLVFRTMGRTGRLVILYYARGVPFPVEIILNIEASTLADKGRLGIEVPFAHRLIHSQLRTVAVKADI